MRDGKCRITLRRLCRMAMLPECLVQLIWEFLPMYDGVMLSRSSRDLNRALQKEVNLVRMLRRIAKIDGMCMNSQLWQVRSLRSANAVSLRVEAVPLMQNKLTKVCGAIKFFLQCSQAQILQLSDGNCAFALERILMSARQNTFETLSLTNVMGYYRCNRQTRACLSELAKFHTREISIEETFIDFETLSYLLLAISRVQCLGTIKICKTWIQASQSGHLAHAIRGCSQICITKCGLTSEHVYLLSPVFEASNVRKLDLSYNAINCNGVNQLFVALSRAKRHVLSALKLEGTFDFVDDEDGHHWDREIFDTFCKSQRGLEHLNLSANYLDDTFVCDNKKAISRLKKLQTLRLACNCIGDDGVYQLSRFKNRLVKLDLKENSIKMVSITHSTTRLFHHLERLDLGETKLSSGTLVTLADCARKGVAFTNLRHLSMENCDFSDPHASLVFDVILGVSRLVFLSLEYNSFSDVSHKFFCDELERENITERRICIWMPDNPIIVISDVPAPHCIITQY